MASLLDIGIASETVPVQGTDIPVSGISARDVVVLLSRFPEARQFFAGKGEDITPERLVTFAPELVACLIAAGTGNAGNVGAEEVAARLGVGDQLDLLASIIRLTIPAGIGPFVAKLRGLGDAVGGSGWAADTKSPEPSNTASRTDTRQRPPGVTRQDNSAAGSS